ncbi:hypothetical protein CHCC20488_0051 [Bacillus paralicheniformis]|uniref:Uncharacterized protein n=1 Tax=Bacillus paralicheniformis TaxID=1648923 RepID=A0ABY3FZU0_9BACI|nr:hypothetical protein CHCC20497_2490 [Bacillus paralicheniformis]TWL42231.1 hypothetical protein CHCC15381_4839 [Bacillus paralicheniformis]TWN39242.1 hypothetical protein CHCC14523_2939 [Bacillus paralicheniformis]TWN88233.1 hypothetical protein CHCC20492_4590 [Bacillus paralicheniformis]TWO03215.1 hypothetical protein CHCC20488_0051 [Bacillus paralicheniformis]
MQMPIPNLMGIPFIEMDFIDHHLDNAYENSKAMASHHKKI